MMEQAKYSLLEIRANAERVGTIADAFDYLAQRLDEGAPMEAGEAFPFTPAQLRAMADNLLTFAHMQQQLLNVDDVYTRVVANFEARLQSMAEENERLKQDVARQSDVIAQLATF